MAWWLRYLSIHIYSQMHCMPQQMDIQMHCHISVVSSCNNTILFHVLQLFHEVLPVHDCKHYNIVNTV